MLAFLENCWKTSQELAPWLLLGAAAGGALHVWLPGGWLRRQLQGRWGVLKSVALGVPLPLCSCGVIPVGLSLKKQGASTGASVGFLISTPQTGVDSVMVSGAMLGWPFALFKVAAAAVTGVVGGWLADRLDKPLPALSVLDHPQDIPVDRSLRGAVQHALELLQSLWRWLAVGIVASALINTLVPQGALGDLGAVGDLAAMLVTLLISVPLYVCATASVPIAASLVASGLPIGAALVFLMAGPATNLATMGAVRKTLGTRALAIYLTVIIAGSIAAGLFFQSVLAGSGTPLPSPHRHGPGWWLWVSRASAAAMLGLMAMFAWRESRAVIVARRVDRSDLPSQSVDVHGMTCEGCVNKLAQTILANDKVTGASVTLSPPRATVEGELTHEELKGLVRDAGFRPEESIVNGQ